MKIDVHSIYVLSEVNVDPWSTLLNNILPPGALLYIRTYNIKNNQTKPLQLNLSNDLMSS